MKKAKFFEQYDSSKRASPAIEEFVSLLQYKDVLGQLIRRNILVRYKRSLFGVAWTMLNPLGTMIVLSIVFSQVFNRGLSYPVYVLTGLTIWNFFTYATRQSMSSILSGSSLFDRIYLPRTVFVISTIGTALVNSLLSMVPLILIMIILKSKIHLTLLMFPIPFLLLSLFSLGVSLFLSAFVLYFPDITEIYPILLTAWMYMSPIIIPIDFLQKILRGWLMKLNPIAYYIEFFRDVVVNGTIPSISHILLITFFSIMVFSIGWIFFTYKSDDFAYHI